MDKLDVDPVHDEIFIPDAEGAILVFPRKASGDVAPIRVIRGPDTGLSIIGALAVDPIHNVLVVIDGRAQGASVSTHQQDIRRPEPTVKFLRIFNRTDDGNVKPRAMIEAPKEITSHTNQIQIYPPKGWILVTMKSSNDHYVMGVWNVSDRGAAPPHWLLGDMPNGFSRPGAAVAFDSKHKEVFVTGSSPSGGALIMRYSFPELF